MVVVSKYDTCTVHPGELYFGTAYAHIRTLLGSCVALTAWHPKLKVGGLCHYLLTEPKQKNASTQGKISARDYRYAQNALLEMRLAMLRVSNPKEFQIGLFGGGDMFAYSGPTSIGSDNIAYAREWLIQEDLKPYRVDVGGAISRSLTMVMTSGEIQVKHYQMSAD